MLPSYYEFYNSCKIISGKKALDNLPYELRFFGANRPLIITDKGVVAAGLIELVKEAFKSSDMTIGAIFDEVPPDSSLRVITQIAAVYRENKCDSFVAVGGGSPMDTAKGVNMVISEGSDKLSDFMGADMLTKPMRPFIAVPTTSGTGSEVTLAAVIADTDKNIKMPFVSQRLIASASILDPRMTFTMPPRITAATGMDALTHAMEAYTCIQKNPMSDAYAHAAIKMISEHLVKVVTNGQAEDGRLAMANAATLAGAAFSNSMTGMIHSLGHATGGACHVPHGVAMSIFLPFGLEYNMKKTGEYLAEMLLPFGGVDEYVKTPANRRAQRLIELVVELRRKLRDLCGLPMTLKEAGVGEGDLEKIARLSIDDPALTFNPEEMDYNDALEVLKRAYQ
jgi:alcohol dehydrogenase